MTNDDKMLNLVISDPNLIAAYEYDPNEYGTLNDALNSSQPIIVAIAKIIIGIKNNTDKAKQKEVYIELFNYLNKSL